MIERRRETWVAKALKYGSAIAATLTIAGAVGFAALSWNLSKVFASTKEVSGLSKKVDDNAAALAKKIDDNAAAAAKYTDGMKAMDDAVLSQFDHRMAVMERMVQSISDVVLETRDHARYIHNQIDPRSNP